MAVQLPTPQQIRELADEMEEGHYASCHFGKELKLKGAM